MLLGLKPGLKGFEEMRGGLKAEEHGLQPGEIGLEGEEQGLKGEELFLEPGQLGLEGEEQVLKAEESLLKPEELFFEQTEPGLQEMRHSLQPTASGVAYSTGGRVFLPAFPSRPSLPAQGGGFSNPPFHLAPPCAPCLPLPQETPASRKHRRRTRLSPLNHDAIITSITDAHWHAPAGPPGAVNRYLVGAVQYQARNQCKCHKAMPPRGPRDPCRSPMPAPM